MIVNRHSVSCCPLPPRKLRCSSPSLRIFQHPFPIILRLYWLSSHQAWLDIYHWAVGINTYGGMGSRRVASLVWGNCQTMLHTCAMQKTPQYGWFWSVDQFAAKHKIFDSIAAINLKHMTLSALRELWSMFWGASSQVIVWISPGLHPTFGARSLHSVFDISTATEVMVKHILQMGTHPFHLATSYHLVKLAIGLCCMSALHVDIICTCQSEFWQ